MKCPKERMAAFPTGKPIDRLPVVPDTGVTMAGFLGHTANEYYMAPMLSPKPKLHYLNGSGMTVPAFPPHFAVRLKQWVPYSIIRTTTLPT